jgi:hypothetical protein
MISPVRRMHFAASMDLIGAQVGNYFVRERIGGGGMGTVYLCEHPLLGRRAALKVLHEDLATDDTVVERFFHEAKAVNEIQDEHIVDVLDFGRFHHGKAELFYLIMELLEGESLAARLRRGPLTPAQTLHIMEQCCSALAASHDKGIVHRDLKPENIFLCRRGNDNEFVKIVDFGIAKLMADPSASHTRTGMVLGTPQYMSPEQCEGKGHVDHRADIYSLGVVLFECLTGRVRVPFDDEGVGDVIVAHMTRPPPRPRELRPALSAGLEAVVLHALEKDPARRFQSMKELAAALTQPDAHLRTYEELPRAPTLAAKMPTTLSGATGELQHHDRPVAPILASVFGVLALAGLAGTLGFGLSWRAQKRQVVPPAPAAAPMIRLVFTTDPPGAAVERLDTGVPLGITPFSIAVRQSSPAFPVELRHIGYLPVHRTIQPDESRELVLAMTPLPPEKPAAVEKPPRSKKSKPARPANHPLLMQPEL